MNFVKGVIDSKDLLLNLAPTILQRSKILKVIRKKLMKKCIEWMVELLEKDKVEFMKFYELFSLNLKLGLCEEAGINRTRLAKLLNYPTSMSGDKLYSLGR